MREQMSSTRSIKCLPLSLAFNSLPFAVTAVLMIVALPHPVRAVELKPGDIVGITGLVGQSPATAVYGELRLVKPETGDQTLLAGFSTRTWGGHQKTLVIHSDGLIYGSILNDLWSYNPTTEELTKLLPVGTSVSGIGFIPGYAVSIGSRIYFGSDDLGFFASSDCEEDAGVVVFDPEANTLMPLSSCGLFELGPSIGGRDGLWGLAGDRNGNLVAMNVTVLFSIDLVTGEQTRITPENQCGACFDGGITDLVVDHTNDFYVLGDHALHSLTRSGSSSRLVELSITPGGFPGRIAVGLDGTIIVLDAITSSRLGQSGWLWGINPNDLSIKVIADFPSEGCGWSNLGNPGYEAVKVVPADYEPPALGPGQCRDASDCDDGLFCNGAESCVAGSCQPGTPPVCDDGAGCTIDSCNEASNACDHTPNHAFCDDGLYCNGAETCVEGSCQSGTPPNCDDGVECTTDSCNESMNACDNTPNHAFCDDEVFCNGAERCGATAGCEVGTDPCPDRVCDEDIDGCLCEEDSDCDDGLFCNGIETCDDGTCTGQNDIPCQGPDGDSDCAESCDEEADSCTASDPDGSLCDDGVFCNGADTCSGGTCSTHVGDPCQGPDGDSDCSESCDEALSNCEGADPDEGGCDDGLFCKTGDRCLAGICDGKSEIDCMALDENSGCTVGVCNENTKQCEAQSAIEGQSCSDGSDCTTGDACSDGLCQPGGSPCSATETCIEVDGEHECLACITAQDCDDGIASNLDRCDEDSNTCEYGELVVQGPASAVVGTTKSYSAMLVLDNDSTENVTSQSKWRVVDFDNPNVISGCGSITSDGILTVREHCIGQQATVESVLQVGIQRITASRTFCICLPQNEDCCLLEEDTPGQTLPDDEDGDGVLDNDDLCSGTSSGEIVDSSGCSVSDVLDDIPSGCGTCGTVGMISWTMLFIGFVGLRKSSLNDRHRLL